MAMIKAGGKIGGRFVLREHILFLRSLFELIVIVILLFLANRRSWYCFFLLDDREYYCEYGNTSTDFFWWGILAAGIILLIIQRGLIKEYLLRWKANWPLLIFIAYSVSSLVWTVNVERSIHTIYIMLAASVSAAGLAVMYSREQIFKLLLWFAGFVALLSLLAVIVLPKTAITQVFYLAGTWRGVFWHKNYLGSMMAFGNGLFLFQLIQGKGRYRVTTVSSIFYLLTLFLVVMSQSGTGLITLVLLNGLIGLYVAWLKWGKIIRPRYYILFLVVSSLFLGGTLLNLPTIFSLIGKQPSLTGRLPLWQYLLRDVVSKRPWFGYGLETIWYDRDFQVASGKAAGWMIIVVNSHSGYMDILVYLGLVGLISFLIGVIWALIHASRYALNPKQSYSFVPLLILAYVLIANVTISYLLEFESFHWVLFVLVLFMTIPSLNQITAQQAPDAVITS